MQAISWEARDIDEEFMITCYGRSKDSKSVSVSFNFSPYFFVKIPPTLSFDQLCRELKRDGVSYTKHRGKSLWGFTNSELFSFMKLSFKSLAEMRALVSLCRYKKLKIYEANIDPLLRFMHRSGIQSTGWLDTGSCGRAFITTCDTDLLCEDWTQLKPVDDDTLAEFKIASFDIECYSSSGSFPDPDNPNDVVFQIAVTTNLGEQECLSLGKADGCLCFETEKDLLDGFKEYIVKLDPDVLTGWNIFGFDLEYIYKRMIINKCEMDTFCMGRRRMDPCKYVAKQLSSSALGQNVLKMVPMSGRYIFDLFQLVKAEHRLESYSLNNVSLEFLGDKKNDMPIKELFELYKSGADLTRVADYCKKDTELPLKIMKKLYTFENLVEMAKATWVPLSFLSERGQQIKVFSQIAKKARELNFFIPTIDQYEAIKKMHRLNPGKTEDEIKKMIYEENRFEGATVLDAQCGAYYGPITALDFASLYPSIMMAHNLCYSTLVMDKKYANLPGVTYETHGEHVFAQNVPSLLPDILADLKKFRKKAKQDMARSKGTHMYHIYNGKQLAYKISMNSVYGFTGASRGILPCIPIAATVTAQGRTMIQLSKEYVEKNFPGAKVRYGDTDSIMVEFDIGVKLGEDAIEYSWQLGERAAEEITGIFKQPNELELEKVYCPYFLYSKKRYAAKMWIMGQDGIEFDKVDIKGLQVVRRDNCPFVRETCQELINMLLESSDPSGALAYINDKRNDLKNGEVPMEKLILSKRLGDSYKNCNLAHVAVRDKIKQRMPGSEPLSGDRVQFVIVKGPKKAKMYEKAEDPKWVIDNNLELDYEYYLKHQFENPIEDLMEPVLN